MKVSEIMTTDVATASPQSTLESVAKLMRRENVGSIPIVDEDGDLAGIITDRDIVVRAIAQGRDPSDCRVEEVLSDDCEIIDAESPVEEAAHIFARDRIRRLPVVREGRLVGIVSIGDVAVKQHDDELTGETLEGISEGVKHSSRGAQIGSSPKADRNRMANSSTSGAMKEGMPGSDRGLAATEKASRERPAKLASGDPGGPKRAYPHIKHSGGISQESEVEQAAEKRATLGPVLVRRENHKMPAPPLAAGRSRKQGVTSHSGKVENKRQEKVMPMRQDNRVRNKHVSKPHSKNDDRKTG